jgi:hypothetical protein
VALKLLVPVVAAASVDASAINVAMIESPKPLINDVCMIFLLSFLDSLGQS